MQITIFLIPFILILGCSDKSSNLQDIDTKYQRFLSDKAQKGLDKGLESYNEK